MTEYGWTFAVMLMLFVVQMPRPSSVRCGDGYYVLGVRPSGRSRCVKAPAGRGENECVRGTPCRFTDDVGTSSYPVQLDCVNGFVPLVVDERTIGCRRRP